MRGDLDGESCGIDSSSKFKQYFINGNVDYLGRVNRFTKQKAVEIENTSYIRFCAERNIRLPTGYRMVFSNLDASFRSVSKYDKGQPILDEGAWALAGDWTVTHFYPYMCDSKVLSENVVLGEMDMSTSCGYPASLEYHSKKEFIGLSAFNTVNPGVGVDDYLSLSDQPKPVCFSILSDYWDIIGTGNEDNIIPIWTCSQKIEMRAVEKLRLNKVRTFTAAPIEHSVATNRLCLDMNNKFYSSNNKTWSFVGGTKYLSGWDGLYRRLNKHKNAFELDESEYDSSLFARAMYGQADIRWNFFSSEFKTVQTRTRLDAIYESIVNSVIVLENGELIQKHTGNPSGSSNTIVDNTMILFRLFAYAWIVLCNERKTRPDYSEFMREVEAALNGDDNTFTVSDLVVGWFNPTGIARIWSGVGVTTNTPCSDLRPLRDVSFLSQGFAYDKELRLWFPVPDTQRILSALCYGSSIDDVRFHLLRANALRLDSYGNRVARVIIQDYINFILVRYKADLFGSVEIHGNSIPMSEITDLWKSDAYIEALYSGYEGSDDTRDRSALLQVVETVRCHTLL